MTQTTKMLLDSYIDCRDAYTASPSEDTLNAMHFAYKALDSRLTRIEARTREVYDDTAEEKALAKLRHDEPRNT